MSILKITKLFSNVWQFHENSDVAKVDAYLIVGKERAALIDCLQSVENLYDEVRKLTSLPFDVYITHGHFDHLGTDAKSLHSHGCKIYMDKRDFEIPSKMHGFNYPENFFTEINDGDTIDLGGTSLSVLEIPGHTPGSVAFLDRENERLYSGDGIGSGCIWLQIPFTLRLSEFTENLQKLRKELEPYKNLEIYPGHRYQSPTLLKLDYIDDVLTLSEKILSGEIVGKEKKLNLGGVLEINFREASLGKMTSFCYDPNRL